MEDTPIPANKLQLYINALNALSMAGVNLNDGAVIQAEAQRLNRALIAAQTPPPEDSPPEN